MATEKKFIEEFLAGLFEVRVHPMMGEYVLYCRDKSVGCICENQVFVKITPQSKRYLEGAPEVPPYLGAKPRYLVENLDKSFLQELLLAVADGLSAPKKKK
jgi:TfoX/Sxy family transcriptional regulator of competence genes